MSTGNQQLFPLNRIFFRGPRAKGRDARPALRGYCGLWPWPKVSIVRPHPPFFGPPPGTAPPYIVDFINSVAGIFIWTPTPTAQKRLCQKPPKNIAGIFSFGVVDKPQPKVQGPRMFFFCPNCKIWHVVVLDTEPHNQCDICKADLLTEGQRRSK